MAQSLKFNFDTVNDDDNNNNKRTNNVINEEENFINSLTQNAENPSSTQALNQGQIINDNTVDNIINTNDVPEYSYLQENMQLKQNQKPQNQQWQNPMPEPQEQGQIQESWPQPQNQIPVQQVQQQPQPISDTQPIPQQPNIYNNNQQLQQQQQQPNQNIQNKKQKKKNNIKKSKKSQWILIGGIAALVIIFCAVCLFLTLGNSDNSENTGSTNSTEITQTDTPQLSEKDYSAKIIEISSKYKEAISVLTTSSMKDAKSLSTALDKIISNSESCSKELKELNPPDNYKDKHNKLCSIYDDATNLFKEIKQACDNYNNGKITAQEFNSKVTELTNDLNKITQKANDL